jgi:hypothetical protein
LQAAHTALATNAGLATTAIDLPSVVSYLHLQGVALSTVAKGHIATIIKEILKLNAEYTKLRADYALLTAQLTALQTQAADIPAAIANLQTTFTTAIANLTALSHIPAPVL